MMCVCVYDVNDGPNNVKMHILPGRLAMVGPNMISFHRAQNACLRFLQGSHNPKNKQITPNPTIPAPPPPPWSPEAGASALVGGGVPGLSMNVPNVAN